MFSQTIIKIVYIFESSFLCALFGFLVTFNFTLEFQGV